MIGRLNHVAIAVSSLEKGTAIYRGTLGAKVSPPQPEPAPRGSSSSILVFGCSTNTTVTPCAGSPIAKFLEKNPDGGIHHVCYEVADIIAARDQLKAEGARVLGDGEPKIGAHGKPVLFLHPKDFCGTLVELEQV
jgi:methylmalonyl-CoA/ethylmalonyl-CoA epimerase